MVKRPIQEPFISFYVNREKVNFSSRHLRSQIVTLNDGAEPVGSGRKNHPGKPERQPVNYISVLIKQTQAGLILSRIRAGTFLFFLPSSGLVCVPR